MNALLVIVFILVCFAAEAAYSWLKHSGKHH